MIPRCNDVTTQRHSINSIDIKGPLPLPTTTINFNTQLIITLEEPTKQAKKAKQPQPCNSPLSPPRFLQPSQSQAPSPCPPKTPPPISRYPSIHPLIHHCHNAAQPPPSLPRNLSTDELTNKNPTESRPRRGADPQRACFLHNQVLRHSHGLWVGLWRLHYRPVLRRRALLEQVGKRVERILECSMFGIRDW